MSIDNRADASETPEHKKPQPNGAVIFRKAYRGKHRPVANREYKVTLPKELRTGVLSVRADVYIREWRRDGASLIVVPSAPLSSLLVTGE